MRPVRKLKKALDKTDSVRPLLAMQEDDETSVAPRAPLVVAAVGTGRRLVLTNVAWKSWVPRLGIGLALVVSACVVVGLRPGYWNIALVMAVLGAFFVFKTKAETYTFDGDTQQFVWQRKTLFTSVRREHWFHDIQSVKLVELSDGQGGLDSNLYVCLTDGARVKIFSGQLVTLKDRSRVLAKQQIERFLASCAASDSESEQGSPLPPAAGPPPPVPLSPVAADTPTTPSGTKGMQRRITAVLGRGSARNKSPSRKLGGNGGGGGGGGEGTGPPLGEHTNDIV